MTQPDPETAHALLYRQGLDEDIIDGALCLHAQELAAAIRSTDLPDWSDTTDLFDNGASWAADLIDPTVPDVLAGTANAEQHRAASSAPVPATTPAADALVAEARRAVHESLILLPAWEADRVRALIADLETAVEGRTAMPAAVSPPADRAACTGECDPTTGAFTHGPACPDRASLRDRLRRAICEEDGCDFNDESIAFDDYAATWPATRVIQLMNQAGRERDEARAAALPTSGPSAHVGRADRDRIADALYPTYGQQDRTRSLAIADAVLAVLPAADQRAAVLREAEDAVEGMYIEDENPDERSLAFNVALDEVITELRRLAGEPQQGKPWLSDASIIGRALIWTWADIGKGAYGKGYRDAQEQARALLNGPQESVEARQDPAQDGTGACSRCGHKGMAHYAGVGGCRDCPRGWPAVHRFSPSAAARSGQPETDEEAKPVHACPEPGDNGISSCCGRPPCEFVGERLTRDPEKVTCRGN